MKNSNQIVKTIQCMDIPNSNITIIIIKKHPKKESFSEYKTVVERVMYLVIIFTAGSGILARR